MKGAIESLSRRNFVISVEHASNHIPSGYHNLGLNRRQLNSHIAWDPGARRIAAACGRALDCPVHEGGHSRLLVDLNRSLRHPRLMARRSFSIAVPGNRDISKQEYDKRIWLYYMPFRNAVMSDVRRIVTRENLCVHLSVHSFTPEVDGVARKADIGILYDPRRAREALLAAQFIEVLSGEGYRVRRNYPYYGTSDGHTTSLRRVFPERKYAGLEIEVNQALVKSDPAARLIANRIAAAAKSLLTV